MPRHRIERKPRHRAPRPTRERPRRAELPAVATRPLPSHAKPPEGPSPSDRLAELGAKYWPYQRRLLTGAVRGLVVSPWFAAGAGFVVAAGAFIYAPHASLSFGTAPQLTLCKEAGCNHPLVQSGVGRPPVFAGQGTPVPTPSATASQNNVGSGHHRSDGADGSDSPTFTYAVKSESQGTFQMTFTVTSSQPIGSWSLSFQIPGATHLAVPGTTWQPSGSDGGTVSGPGVSSQTASPGTTGDPGGAGYHSQDGGQSDVVTFVVDGDGEPTGPVNCSFHDAQGNVTNPVFTSS